MEARNEQVLPLERYAVVRAALAEQHPLSEVLAAAGLESAAWRDADLGWKERLATADGDLLGVYERSLSCAEDRMVRAVLPIDRDPLAWASFCAAFSKTQDPAAFLGEKGLGPNDLSRLTRAWRARIEKDPSLSQRLASAQRASNPLPEIAPGPRAPVSAAVAARGAPGEGLSPVPDMVSVRSSPIPESGPAAAPSRPSPLPASGAAPSFLRGEIPAAPLVPSFLRSQPVHTPEPEAPRPRVNSKNLFGAGTVVGSKPADSPVLPFRPPSPPPAPPASAPTRGRTLAASGPTAPIAVLPFGGNRPSPPPPSSRAAVLPQSTGTPHPVPSGPLPAFSVHQYASLAVELALWPDRKADTLRRYGLTEAQKGAVDASFHARLADGDERRRFAEACATYRHWLLSRGG